MSTWSNEAQRLLSLMPVTDAPVKIMPYLGAHALIVDLGAGPAAIRTLATFGTDGHCYPHGVLVLGQSRDAATGRWVGIISTVDEDPEGQVLTLLADAALQAVGLNLEAGGDDDVYPRVCDPAFRARLWQAVREDDAWPLAAAGEPGVADTAA